MRDLYIGDRSCTEGAQAAASVQKISAPLGTTFRDAYTGKEDQSQDFGTNYTDFGARQYSPALRRWMAPDLLSEKYYGISPYAFCANNPLRYVDPDGKDGWDVFIGHSIGLITNVIPGTGSLRDLYSPTDPLDYNLALRNSDLASFAIGDFLTKAGAAEAALGGSLLAAGATSVSASGGTLVLVGGLAAAIGAEELVRGALTAAGGGLMMMNSSKNQLDGYERGNTSTSQNKGGENSHTKLGREIHKKYNPGQGYIKECQLPSGKRADAVSFEKGDVRELKPNNTKAFKKGEKQVLMYKNELQSLNPSVNWEWHVDVYEK